MLFSHMKISSFRAKAPRVLHWCLYNKYTSLNNNHRNDTIFSYQKTFKSIDHSLHPTGRVPWIILRLWGFLCVRDPGHRGNKITVWYERICRLDKVKNSLTFPWPLNSFHWCFIHEKQSMFTFTLAFFAGHHHFPLFAETGRRNLEEAFTTKTTDHNYHLCQA